MNETHIIVKNLDNGFVNLTAENGYVLFSLRTESVVSEAVVKEEDMKYFVAKSNE